MDPAPRKPQLEDALSIPVVTQSGDDPAGQDAFEKGRHLARQEKWCELAAEIRCADAARATAPGGIPVAELLAFGARSDVVLAVEQALSDKQPKHHATLTEGISELEFVLREHHDDPVIALIVALAHIDIAWIWRGTGWENVIHQINRERCAAHFDRAAQILPVCRAAFPDSPLVTSASCSLLAGQRSPGVKVADEYERLIALDPCNHRYMRAMGNHLLPRWFGSYDELELEARRAASLTHKTWGAGGYTWVLFDAIALDEMACARVDVEFFLDGLRDIVKRRPDQEMINLLAAYCSITLQQGFGLDEEADLVRTQLCEAADWLIRDHLTELHPLIWAHAADGFNNSARVNSPDRFAARGRKQALQVIAALFRDELRNGQRVIFTPSGPRVTAN
ncbi:hypothetical protein FGK63_10860 [Ruegeria sediminis]|uniref:Uncharacterized protein n=1 Tax=Ruegeria sediminis TaxID=2583820 RepID=A0ABY2X005_9RHOB|nr:hypothetical protein FGK63_10860 [Ruegeria sediminis]